MTVLLLGDDWAEDHHDVELQDEHGTVLARRRLPEGVTGIRRLHELIVGGGPCLRSTKLQSPPGERMQHYRRELSRSTSGLRCAIPLNRRRPSFS